MNVSLGVPLLTQDPSASTSTSKESPTSVAESLYSATFGVEAVGKLRGWNDSEPSWKGRNGDPLVILNSWEILDDMMDDRKWWHYAFFVTILVDNYGCLDDYVYLLFYHCSWYIYILVWLVIRSDDYSSELDTNDKPNNCVALNGIKWLCEFK